VARTRTTNWTISSPGRLPDRVVIFDLPDAHLLDLAEIQITSSIPTLLTGENAELNAAIYTDRNGVEYAPGTVLLFDLVAASDIEPNHSGLVDWDPEQAHRVYIRYATDDADEQDLTYEKIVEVYRRIPLE
jgi:hypothetical protein